MKPVSALRGLLKSTLDPRLTPVLYPEFKRNPVVIWDVGAAGGVYTPFAAGPAAWAPVIGFEPHPESYQKLIEAEGSPNIQLYD